MGKITIKLEVKEGKLKLPKYIFDYDSVDITPDNMHQILENLRDFLIGNKDRL